MIPRREFLSDFLDSSEFAMTKSPSKPLPAARYKKDISLLSLIDMYPKQVAEMYRSQDVIKNAVANGGNDDEDDDGFY